MFMPTTSHTISHTTSYAMFIRLDLERGSGGSNCMHDRAGTGVCMAMDSFRHRPPNQRRQGQAAPERHRRRTAARPGPSAGRPSGAGRPSAGGGRWRSAGGFGASEDSASSARRRRGFEENVLAWTEGTHDQCAACAYTRRCACAQCRACRAAACACNRRHACVHVNASMRACRAAAARFRRERNRLDRRNT